MSRWLAALALTSLVPASRPSEAAPSTRAVEVVALDGDPVSGPFVGLAADGVRVDGRDEPIALDGIRELRFRPDPVAAAAATQGAAVRIVLQGGEVLRGSLTSGDETGVELTIAGADPVKVPFDWMRRIEAAGASRGPCDEPDRWYPRRENADVAYARSGDAFAGTLSGASRDGVSIESGGDRRTVRWDDLTVLHVDEPELPPPSGLSAE